MLWRGDANQVLLPVGSQPRSDSLTVRCCTYKQKLPVSLTAGRHAGGMQAHHDIIVGSHPLDIANALGAMILADAPSGGACQLAAGLVNPLANQRNTADDKGGPAGRTKHLHPKVRP